MKHWLLAAIGVALASYCVRLFGPVALIVAVIAAAVAGTVALIAARSRRPWMPLCACLGLFLLLAGPALAQTTTIDVGGIYGAWKPYLVEIAGTLILAMVTIVLELLRRKLGLNVEKEHRDALQVALTNAAGKALNELGNQLQGREIPVNHPAVARAVNYVGKSAPDALRKFGLTEKDLAEKIVAKIPQVAHTVTPPAGG